MHALKSLITDCIFTAVQTTAVTNPFQEATLQNGPFISSYREFSTCDIFGIYIGVIGINIGIVLGE